MACTEEDEADEADALFLGAARADRGGDRPLRADTAARALPPIAIVPIGGTAAAVAATSTVARMRIERGETPCVAADRRGCGAVSACCDVPRGVRADGGCGCVAGGGDARLSVAAPAMARETRAERGDASCMPVPDANGLRVEGDEQGNATRNTHLAENATDC